MRQWMLVVFALTSVYLVSCTKDPLSHLNEEESRIYVTNSDSTVDFSNFQTYSISDSVVVLDNTGAHKDLTSLDQAYIEAVNKYMQQRGYTLVAKESDPDLGVNVNRIYSTSTGYFGYDSYWDYYGGYWDPYYWGYGGYGYYVPYTYGIYQITEGAMSVDMIDLKDAQDKGSLDVIWNGLARGEGLFNASNADTVIKALFDQSAYIHTN